MLAKQGLLLVVKDQTILWRTWTLRQSNAKEGFSMDLWHVSLAFLSKSTSGEKFWFLLAFLSKFINGKSLGHFGHGYIYWPLWLWIRMVKVKWFAVCHWATSGIPLRHTQARVRRRQLLALCCAIKSSTPGGNCLIGIISIYIYAHRKGRE